MTERVTSVRLRQFARALDRLQEALVLPDDPIVRDALPGYALLFTALLSKLQERARQREAEESEGTRELGDQS